jgi:protease IV
MDPQQVVHVEIQKSSLEKFTEIFKFVIKTGLFLLFVFFMSSVVSGQTMPLHNYDSSYVDWYDNTLIPDINTIIHDKVVIIPVNGMIINNNMGFMEGTSSETILTMLHDAQNDPEVKAIILRIDSPGGTVLDSEKIAQKIIEVKQSKKVYALLESLAASGGYYIASQTHKIFAYKETLTGSIGVVMEIPNATKLMNTVGVEMLAIHAGKNKTMGSPFDILTDEAKNIFQSLVDESYEHFIERVASGRSMDIEGVRVIADGRIYSGSQALKIGLIDDVDGIYGLQQELEKEGLQDADLIRFSLPQSPLEDFLRPLGQSVLSWFPQSSQNMMILYKAF